MGGVFRSLWRRPNDDPDHDVENPLLTSAAPEVDSSSLGARPPLGELEPPVPTGRTPRPRRLLVSSSLGDSGCHPSALQTFSGRYQTPQLRDLVHELSKVADWHLLGVQLRLPPDKLDKIEEDHKRSERRLCKVLEYWLNNETDPSWNKICEALRRMGGFAKLERELKVKYCSLSAPEFCSSITCAHCNQHHCKFKLLKHYNIMLEIYRGSPY